MTIDLCGYVLLILLSVYYTVLPIAAALCIGVVCPSVCLSLYPVRAHKARTEVV